MGESKELYYVELKELDDLVRLVTFSPMPILHHLALKKTHMYFARFGSRQGSPIIYYVTTKSRVSGKYVVYNILRGSIEFADTVSTDTGLRHISVLEVSSQDIFPEEMLRRLGERLD